MVAKLTRWAEQAVEKTFHLHRLDIGRRLTLCFALIILAMLVGNAVLLWQFQQIRAQADRQSGVDQELIAVLQIHTSLLSFCERLDGLAQSEDSAGLVREAEPLRNALLENTQRSRNALSRLPPGVQLDPTLLPSLEAIQSTLPEQLEAITALAKSRDWEAVRSRLANQVRPVESLTSALVQNVDREVSEERAQAVLKIGQAQRRILLIVPITAALTLLIAAFLGWALRHSITQPLGRLMEGSKALARGEFQHRVAISGEDELAHLGRVFNDTAGRLRDLYATLQASEDRLRLVINTIPAHVWSARPDGSVDFISERWLETTGLSVKEGLGWDWGSVVHPDDLARYVDEWQRALAAGEPMESEARLRRAGGEYRWWLIRNVPLRDELGNIVKWYGTSVDIEDRKRAEERVRQDERELRQLIEVIPQHVIVLEPDGSLLYVNQVGREYTGLTLEDSVAKDALAKIFHPDDLERVLEERRRGISRGEQWEAEARIRGKDGEYRWFLIRANPLRNEQGCILRWYGTRTDIEDRKQAEDALRRSQAYLTEAQTLSHTGSFGWNLSSGEVSWSEQTFRIFEWDPASFTPSVDSIVQRIHPEDVDRVRQEFNRAAEEGTAADLEHRLLMPDGSVKYVHVVAHGVRDSSGQLEFVGAVMDVTAGKQAQEALRQAQATLARFTRVTTLGEMAASIAHEVNQPIAAAITNSNTCLRWLMRDPPDVGEAREAAARCVKDARRAADIIKRIRLLFKKGAPPYAPVDVNEAIREIIVLLRHEADRYSVLIRADLAADLPKVGVDPVELQQVFMNLMLNGIEAMKDMNGARELTIKSEQTDSGPLHISVSDTGVGLVPEQADQIFNAFFTTKPEGTGMGLPISRSIIESHGGRLWATANAGRGATFHFTLPSEVEGPE
jgi:PAS domain S-box-containing protein